MKPNLLTSRPRPVLGWSAVALSALLLAACGGKGDGPASVAVAKVNKVEVTQAQVDQLLQQQRNLRPEQQDVASRQILERLVEQVLILQKADETKLDRDPRVMQMMESARREVLIRAYLERVAEAAPKPSPEEIKKYYDDKPALFRDRRVYNLQELNIEARPEQIAEIREQLLAAKKIETFVEYLKSAGLRFSGSQAVRAAEQLPPNALDAISRLNDGQALLVPGPSGAQVLVLAGSRVQPATEEQARPAIEQYLLGERKRKLVEDAMKELKAPAKIEYLGKYAAGAASAPASSRPASGASGG
jgi:EpsD family peptidyl-prolyl cis-trans isomerase